MDGWYSCCLHFYRYTKERYCSKNVHTDFMVGPYILPFSIVYPSFTKKTPTSQQLLVTFSFTLLPCCCMWLLTETCILLISCNDDPHHDEDDKRVKKREKCFFLHEFSYVPIQEMLTQYTCMYTWTFLHDMFTALYYHFEGTVGSFGTCFIAVSSLSLCWWWKLVSLMPFWSILRHRLSSHHFYLWEMF